MKITKSKKKLESWSETRALDKLAMPLIYRYGVVEAYRMAVERIAR